MEQPPEYKVTISINHRREEEVAEGEPRVQIVVGLEPLSGGDSINRIDRGVQASLEDMGETTEPEEGGAGSSDSMKTDTNEEPAPAGSSGAQPQAEGAHASMNGNSLIEMTMRMKRKRARGQPAETMLPWERRRRHRRGTFWPFDDENDENNA